MEDGSTSDNLLRSEAELALIEARKAKAERIKDFGSPIQLSGKALALEVREGAAWIAESTGLVKKFDLETGKTLQIYRGHTAPVTSLAFYNKMPGPAGELLITGSWDKVTIKLWDRKTKAVISSTSAHSDFVKCLFIIPELQLLLSSGSDKIVRLWDLSAVTEKSLSSVGFISTHTRPVENIDGIMTSDISAVIYTADTMGVIRAWDVHKEEGSCRRWKISLKDELRYHEGKIHELWYGNGQLWTGSADETVRATEHPTSKKFDKPLLAITHPLAVRCLLPLLLTPLEEPYLLTGAGDIIRIYDVSSPKEPQLLNTVDAHWHDVNALQLWMRKFLGSDGKSRIEPWIVSASLDGTLRRWRLAELLTRKTATLGSSEEQKPVVNDKMANPAPDQFEFTEEEERELAELLHAE